MSNPLNKDLLTKVKDANILMVGAGGIGCELLKNLVLAGFRQIEIIDLDTIDVSNLNRQFLFQKKHIGKAKALVACDSALRLCPDAKIIAHHDTIFNADFNINYYKKFHIVLNALDNLTARNHVNRMCLAANIPLVESGSAGYSGQITLIKKGFSQCYECFPPPRPKTFPGCTIRNTPSEFIHCIVWAKYLFNQLFGEEDGDKDVSPDTADPNSNLEAADITKNVQIERLNTRQWAKDCKYDSKKIFNKLFYSDIKYLISMGSLWKKRTPPTPLEWKDEIEKLDFDFENIDIQKKLSLDQDMALFRQSLIALKDEVLAEDSDSILYWDKDHQAIMDFTSSAANIRAKLFGIEGKCRFEIKSMAGNIIPAIATTNAVVAGFIVMQAMLVLQRKFESCKTVYVSRSITGGNKLFSPNYLDPPNPKCYVCKEKPEVCVKVDFDKLTISDFLEEVLKNYLGMMEPEVMVLDGSGSVLISHDPEDHCEEIMMKPLSSFNLQDGTRLSADDFHREYHIVITLSAGSNFKNDKLFEVIFQHTGDSNGNISNDDMSTENRKRKLSENSNGLNSSKRAKTDTNEEKLIG